MERLYKVTVEFTATFNNMDRVDRYLDEISRSLLVQLWTRDSLLGANEILGPEGECIAEMKVFNLLKVQVEDADLP